MKAKYIGVAGLTGIFIISGAFLAWRAATRERRERGRYEHGETEVRISLLPRAATRLFKAGKNLRDAREIGSPVGERIWLGQGNYFLRVESQRGPLFFPIPIVGYRTGPDPEGTLLVTVRAFPSRTPPRLLSVSPDPAYIPSGHFLLGDRQNPRELSYAWLTAFFISPCEVTNAEFREFLKDVHGYADDGNWTDGGRVWKVANPSQASSQLRREDAEFIRFGRPELPVTGVNWFEANAFCHWLTTKIGAGEWIFSLPTDAEWEKAARGPDNFDYGISMNISDEEVRLYNWMKNPGVPVTVVPCQDTAYRPNRYGLYHMTGNAAEWTQSVFRPYNRQTPYVDDDRNLDLTAGRRTVRGGSWYSATNAPLYIPYRDAFQPDHSSNDLGFRIVARLRP